MRYSMVEKIVSIEKHTYCENLENISYGNRILAQKLISFLTIKHIP